MREPEDGGDRCDDDESEKEIHDGDCCRCHAPMLAESTKKEVST
jgi:hypothetical protein